MVKTKITFGQLSTGIIIPLLIVVIGAVAFLLVWPRYQAVKNTRERLQNKNQALENRRQQLEEVKKVIAEVVKQKRDLEPIEGALPEAPEIPQILGNFDQLAIQSGLLITSLRLSGAPTLETLATGHDVNQVKRIGEIISSTESLGVIQIELTVKGQYANLKAFLLNLEQNLRLMDIQSLVLGEIDEGSKIQEFQVKLQTYYQKGQGDEVTSRK